CSARTCGAWQVHRAALHTNFTAQPRRTTGNNVEASFRMTNWFQRHGGEKDMERRARQIKEIVRLGSSLRVDMSPRAIVDQVITSIHSTIGFDVAALNFIYGDDEAVEIVATAGLSPLDEQRLAAQPPRAHQLKAMMRPEYR